MSQLLALKPIDQLLSDAGTDRHAALRRTLGPWNLIALGIGAIVGAGIFVITGTVAAQNSGPAVVLSFLLAALCCVFAGLCYAELASLIPIAGSAYTYGYATLGELVAWIIGWDLVIEYAFGAATVAAGWSGNVVSLLRDLGIHLPRAITATPADGGVFDLPACIAVFVVTALLVVGIKESANFNALIVLVKVGTIVTFIAVAAAYLLRNPEIARTNWTPFLPPNTGEFGEFGWSGVGRGAAVIFFAFIGFDAVSTAAQESKNPQKDMPVGILGSLAICTLLYIAMGALLTGVLPYKRLGVAAPVAAAIDATGVSWGALVVKIGTFAGLATTMLVMLLGQSRVLYTMSRDGLLPPWVSAVHPKFRTPWLSSIVVGVFVGLFAGLVPIAVLGQLVSIGTLLAFVIVCAGVLILRRTRADLPRAFRTPWVPAVPILGIAISLLLMLTLPLDTWIRLFVWLGLGLLIYFTYGRHHSKLRQ
jgi:basic amino acid/polyamine antiporter, APA family